MKGKAQVTVYGSEDQILGEFTVEDFDMALDLDDAKYAHLHIPEGVEDPADGMRVLVISSGGRLPGKFTANQASIRRHLGLFMEDIPVRPLPALGFAVGELAVRDPKDIPIWSNDYRNRKRRRY